MKWNGMDVSEKIKPTTPNPMTERRMKLFSGIEKQLNHFGDGDVKGSKWYWLEDDGCYYFEVKYGGRRLEFGKKGSSIRCIDDGEVITNLNHILVMVKNGDFDNQLSAISKAITQNFKKR